MFQELLISSLRLSMGIGPWFGNFNFMNSISFIYPINEIDKSRSSLTRSSTPPTSPYMLTITYYLRKQIIANISTRSECLYTYTYFRV